MSDALNEIVTKAINDAAFRRLLITNPDQALQGYELTDEERQILAELNEDNLNDFAGGLGDRSTKGQWISGS